MAKAFSILKSQNLSNPVDDTNSILKPKQLYKIETITWYKDHHLSPRVIHTDNQIWELGLLDRLILINNKASNVQTDIDFNVDNNDDDFKNNDDNVDDEKLIVKFTKLPKYMN